MMKSAMYEMLTSIDIEQFEQEYKKTLNDVKNGDVSLGSRKYTGLVAACDMIYEGLDNAILDAHCMYLALMQVVFSNLAKEKSYEAGVTHFLQSVTQEHVKQLFSMLDAYMQVDEKSTEMTAFEQYCERIESLPVINFGYAYTDRGVFLHKDVELQPQGFLGEILASLYVLSCLTEGGSNVQPGVMRLADTRMYSDRFDLPAETFSNRVTTSGMQVNTGGEAGFEDMLGMYDDSDDSEVGNFDLHATLDQVLVNTMQQTQWLEQQVQQKEQERQQQQSRKPKGRLGRTCFALNNLITSVFGKKVLPLFWIALVLLYAGNISVGIIVTFILYLFGKNVKTQA